MAFTATRRGPKHEFNRRRLRVLILLLINLSTASFVHAQSNSGELRLKVLDPANRQQAIEQLGTAILDRIDFDRGRVRPSLALNTSIGPDLLRRDRIAMRLQADVQNLNNRLNVINFAGLFSGTGIAPPRSYTMRLVTEF